MKKKLAAKLASVVLAAATAVFSAASVPASARYNNSGRTQIEAFTTAFQTYWKQTEKQKFPAGRYWNNPSNPDAYTYSECGNHPNLNHCARVPMGVNFVIGTGTILLPRYGDYNLYQCAGFARKLAKDFYGIPNNKDGVWLRGFFNMGNIQLRAGDQLRIGGTHSVFITDVQGNTVKFADCNAFGKCQIRWDITATVNQNTGTLSYSDQQGYHNYSINYVTRPGMAGDVNGDTFVNSQDRDAILFIANNVYSFSNVNYGYAMEAADLNNDGSVTMDDWNIVNAQLKAPILPNQKFLTHTTAVVTNNYSWF